LISLPLPIYLGKIPTSKEAIYAYSFLDNGAVSAIKDLLEQSKARSDSERVWTADDRNLSRTLRRLARKAKVDFTGNKLRFHCLRKFCFDICVEQRVKRRPKPLSERLTPKQLT
jgi:hypothetical protein